MEEIKEEKKRRRKRRSRYKTVLPYLFNVGDGAKKKLLHCGKKNNIILSVCLKLQQKSAG